MTRWTLLALVLVPATYAVKLPPTARTELRSARTSVDAFHCAVEFKHKEGIVDVWTELGNCRSDSECSVEEEQHLVHRLRELRQRAAIKELIRHGSFALRRTVGTVVATMERRLNTLADVQSRSHVAMRANEEDAYEV